MKIIRTKDYQDMSRKAANIISAQMILKDDSVLGLATGSTPIGIYDQLVDWYKKGDLDFDAIDEAALLLQRATSVYCLGQGGSRVLANDIWVRFATISNKFRNCGDSHTQLIAASLMGPSDVILFVSYSGSTHDMMDTLSVAKKTGAKIILITHYPDAPGTALADVVLLCGALETPLDGGSIPVKVSELFVAESLIMRYLLDNRELAKIARDKTSVAMVAKFL